LVALAVALLWCALTAPGLPAIDAAEAEARKAWRQVEPPQRESLTYSHITSNGEQHVALIMRTYRGKRQGVYEQHVLLSSDAGATWAAPVTIPLPATGSVYERNWHVDNQAVERVAVDSLGRTYVQMGDGRFLDVLRGVNEPMNEAWGIPPPFICTAMYAIGERMVVIAVQTRSDWGKRNFSAGPPERVVLLRDGVVFGSSNGFLAGSATTGAVVGVPDEFGSAVTYHLLAGPTLQPVATPFDRIRAPHRPSPIPFLTTQINDAWIDRNRGLCQLTGGTVTVQPCENRNLFTQSGGVPPFVMSLRREISGKTFLLKGSLPVRLPEARDVIEQRRQNFVEGWLSPDATWDTFTVPTLRPWWGTGCTGMVPTHSLSRPGEIHYVTAGGTGTFATYPIPNGNGGYELMGIWVYVGRGSGSGKARR
jgi:hypothetical protein